MPVIHITKSAVEKLNQPTEGRVDYFDDALKGFGIRVSPTSKTYFAMRRVNGKLVRAKIETADKITAERARKQAEGMLADMGKGNDPNEQKRTRILEEVERRRNPTVKDLIGEYLEKHAMANKKSWKEDKRCLEKEVLPLWGQRKAADIKKRDVVLLLEGIVDRGSPVMANNTLEKIRKMFNFAVERDILEFTPCYGVKKPTKKEHKDRVLTDKEIAAVWKGLDIAAMTDEMKRAIKLILVTGQRPGEVIGLHSSDIEGDWWLVRPEKAKNGRAHRVFLTATAKELIGDKEGFIFESPRGGKPMDVNAVAYAVRRNREEPKEREGATGAEAVTVMRKIVTESWTPHDLRRTAATNMSALGFTDEVIDAILNHVKKGVIAIYNRHRYDKEKQIALESWERRLITIIGQDGKGNVLPFQRKIAQIPAQ